MPAVLRLAGNSQIVMAAYGHLSRDDTEELAAAERALLE